MKKKPGKSILFITPYFAPAWSYGGPVRVTYDFANELVKLGNEVTVATTDALDNKKRNSRHYEILDGIKIFRFKNISNKFAKAYNLYIPFGFSKWLKENIDKFDVVHIHEMFTYQSMVAAKICLRRGKPFVIQPHGSLNQYAKKSRFSFIKKLIIRYFSRFILGGEAIIALTKEEKESILKTFRLEDSKVKIVPNGIDTEKLKKTGRINLYKLYNIKKDNKIVSFLGRIHFQKGLDRSIRAIALLKNRLKITFLIIGPDEGEKSNLMKLAKELKIESSLVFTGILTGERKLKTLKSSELSILLSRSEGLPTTLLESAALGLPIICSPESNFPEVDYYKVGKVVANEQQAAEYLKKILTNDRLKSMYSKNALKLAGVFDVKEKTQQLMDAYNLK